MGHENPHLVTGEFMMFHMFFFVNVPCWLFEDHLKKYLLETISPIVGSSLKLGRLLTPVSCAFFSTMRGMIGRGRHDDKLFVMGFVKATCLTAST